MRLTFQLVADTGKTKNWNVLSLPTYLGYIKWHAPWRRYCFYPASTVLFDVSCLKEIVGFIEERMAERKTT